MNKSRKFFPALAAAGLALAATITQATTVNFGITAATIAPGAGYGVDGGANSENGGTLLDVLFGNAFVTQSFGLVAGEAGHTFDLGTLNFREPNTGSGSNQGIRTQETDNLDVVVSLTLSLPTPVALDLTGTGTATPGLIDDAAVDYMLTWSPLEVDYGNGGKFVIALSPLLFSNVGTQALTATVTLRTAAIAASDDPPPATAVPEPATLALAAIALAGIGASRRKRTA